MQKPIDNPTGSEPFSFQTQGTVWSHQVTEAIQAAQRCDSAWEFFKWLSSGLLRDADRSNQSLSSEDERQGRGVWEMKKVFWVITGNVPWKGRTQNPGARFAEVCVPRRGRGHKKSVCLYG